MVRMYGLSATTCHRLVACGAPFAIFLACAYIMEIDPIKRDLDMVELFSGSGMLTQAARDEGLQCAAYEVSA